MFNNSSFVALPLTLGSLAKWLMCVGLERLPSHFAKLLVSSSAISRIKIKLLGGVIKPK